METAVNSVNMALFDIVAYFFPGYTFIAITLVTYSNDGLASLEDSALLFVPLAYLMGLVIHSVSSYLLPDAFKRYFGKKRKSELPHEKYVEAEVALKGKSGLWKNYEYLDY